MASAVKFSETARRPASPMARACSGVDSNCSSPSASDFASFGSHNRPPPVAAIISGKPPCLGCTTGTPAAIVDRLYQESTKILAQPDTKQRYAELALEISGADGKRLAEIIKNDTAKWAKVIKDANIPPAQ